MIALAPWYLILVIGGIPVDLPMANEKLCRDAATQMAYWHATHCLRSGFEEKN